MEFWNFQKLKHLKLYFFPYYNNSSFKTENQFWNNHGFEKGWKKSLRNS